MNDEELLDHFAGLSLPYAHELWKSYFFSKEMECERSKMVNKGEYFDFEEYMPLIAECSYLMADYMMSAKKEYFKNNQLNLTAIDKLELTNRSYNALKYNDILTIENLINLTKKDLSYLPNIGLGSLNEIIDTLAKHNLKLKGE